MFRIGTRRTRLVANKICSHCLSTTVPPPPGQTSSAEIGGTSGDEIGVKTGPEMGRVRHQGPGISTEIQNIGSQSSKRTMFASARGPNLYDLSLIQKLNGGVPSLRAAHSRPATPAVEGTSASLQLEQVPVPEYQKEREQGIFIGMDTDFPCLARNQIKGPEPSYDTNVTGCQIYEHKTAFHLKYRKGILPEMDIAYETWGELNEAKDNAVIICAGLSASSHAKSHKDNPNAGWWEKFVGPGCAVDTDHFFVICTNNLGGCYGSTGPSSINPLTGKPYSSTFPIMSVEDMVRAQFLLLDHLGIQQLHGSVGSSLGGMMSLTSAVLFPDRVKRAVSISSCVRSHPSSIAMRYLQRKAVMTDPNWQKGYYYGTGSYPQMGMKLAREIATLTYRSGPEWDERFGRKRVDEAEEPSLCPHFMIENYLEHQGENFAYKIDPNTLLYISKAMDLFDLGETFGSLHAALARVTCPMMVIGVQTDILFPVWQQRELAQVLQESGNNAVTYYELNSLFGHDTFLLDLNGVGAGVKGFLETDTREKGRVTKRKGSCDSDRQLF